MKLAEPATTITDYILSVGTYLLAVLLLLEGISRWQNSVLLWGVAFLAIATAALAGGTFHGFPDMNPLVRAGLWKVTVFSIGLSCMFMLAGTVYATQVPYHKWILAVILLNFLVFAIWMIFRNDYKYVVYDSLITMFAVLALLVIYQPPGTKWILIAVLVSFAAAGIQRSGFSPHKHFNHNDLYHVIQMFAMYLFYKGAMILRDI